MSGAAIVQVLLSDLSSAVRLAITNALQGARDMVIVGEIGPKDDIVAVIKRLRPNLVLIGMGAAVNDPFETTKRVMAEAPTPIVIIADSPDAGDVKASVLALRSGALAVMPIPADAGSEDAEGARKRFVSALKAMSEVKLVRRWLEKPRSSAAPQAPIAASRPRLSRAIAIAASTGGPAALHRVLSDLPPDFMVPILVVQHMADGFIDGLAQWLNTVCSLTVKVAVHDEPLKPRTAYLAADGHHLGVSSRSTIALSTSPPINGFRPAADFLFESAARGFGAGLTVVMLTGMGQDGVAALRAVRQLGGEVIAQDELSSVVYGMPKAACDAGLVDSVLPLSAIASKLIELVEVTRDGSSR
jgi:two-component system chemotaxis response regulator CheB